MAYEVATIGGDGIGPEVTAEACKVLEAAGERFGLSIDFVEYGLGARHYLATGEVLSDATLADIRSRDAILLGAVGWPEVPEGLLQGGILMRLRRELDLCVGLRPTRLLPGVPSPIAGLTPEQCDVAVVRDNTEGIFCGAGGSVYTGTSSEVATQESVNTYRGVERVARFAFELADQRRGQLTLCHKTNVLGHAGGLWERVVDELAPQFPDVEARYMNIDAACMHLVMHPDRFDVIVTDTVFGDIITDVGAAVQGGIGYAPSANLNPMRETPGLFEPIHGSAPDIAGSGLADPVAAILSARMLLDHLGEDAAATGVEAAVVTALSERATSPADRPWSTTRTGDRVAELVRSPQR